MAAPPAVHRSLTAALQTTDGARVGAWLQAFLAGVGGNRLLADALRARPWCYLGPVRFPLDRLRRCCGPEREMRYCDPEESWRRRIGQMAHDIRHGWQPPPLIAGTFGAWHMVLMDGNHRHAALGQAGRAEHPVIFVFEDAEDRAAFVASPGRMLR
jgi:hypothetical protein